MNDEPESEQTDVKMSSSIEPLRMWERLVALGVGITSGGAGGYAVFATSNQAGTAVLLALAAVFCLVGIQGTPLIRFASGSNSIELDRRRRSIDQAIEEAKAEENLDKAAGIVQGAVIAEPNLPRPAYYDYVVYEQELRTAIAKIGYSLTDVSRVSDGGFDFVVQDQGSRTIYIETKYYRKPLGMNVVDGIVGKASRTGVPVLLVASSPLTVAAQRIVEESRAIDFIMWRDSRDNDELKAKMREMYARIA